MKRAMYETVVDFIRKTFSTDDLLPLHQPVFLGNDKKYLNECIDSTFVSSVGKFVTQFEDAVAAYTGVQYAIATVNGTSALHVALKLVGANLNSEVITQPLSFIATCNAISYCGSTPVFVDVDRDTMGLSPTKLTIFLQEHTEQRSGGCYNKLSGKKIVAVVPMHTFGHPCRIEEISTICVRHNISLVEDAAESLGSHFGNRHTGSFGHVSALSFNGNKTITTGGGGMILTNDETWARRAKHITTTAKIPDQYEYIHDEIGFNYRMPNINAALGCAQIEQLDVILDSKRELATIYADYFRRIGIEFVSEPKGSRSNYWLNALIFLDKADRDNFLRDTNSAGIMTRPIWRLLNRLEMYADCQTGDLSNAFWLEDRVVNIPSGVRL